MVRGVAENLGSRAFFEGFRSSAVVWTFFSLGFGV